MSFLKHHLSLIIPLVAFLFIYQFFKVSDRVVENYQNTLNSTYSIIVASEKPLERSDVEENVESLNTLEEIEQSEMLDKLKSEISAANLALLKMQLPKFYKITLKEFPDDKVLKRIRTQIEKIGGIKRVETFAKSHNRVYRLLVFNKSISKVFAILIFAISFLLMIKQVELWKFEHIERMEIMALFGAPYWMRSALLFRLAFVDSVISTGITAYAYYFLGHSNEVSYLIADLGIEKIPFDVISDSLVLLVISLAISFVSVLMVISKQRT